MKAKKDKENKKKVTHVESEGFLSRYRGLVGSIVVFLIIITSVLLFSIYAGRSVQQDNFRNTVYSQVRDLTQTITRDLFNLSLNYGEDPNSPHLDYTIKRLANYSSILTQNLDALTQGQPAQGIEGGFIAVAKAPSGQERKILLEITREWKKYRNLIGNYLKDAQSYSATSTPLDLAVYQAQESSEEMYLQTAQVAEIVLNRAQKSEDLLRMIQFGGIATIIVYFIVFLFFFIRRIVNADREMALARRETIEIMDTIQEGLFLIDADLHIGTQQSKELAEILPMNDISGKPLDEVIGQMVSEADLTNTRRFINQLFNKRVKENLLDDLNPLRQVKIMVNDSNGRPTSRYLRFKFNRVYENKQIIRILVTVSNVTESVKIQQLLERERQQNQVQTEMLIKVLHVDQDLLAGFVRRTTQIAQRVNEMLKTEGSSQAELRQKLNDIYREVHSFKGEASALEFDSFVSIAEEAEDKLKQLRNQSKLTGNDFIGVTVILDRLIGLNEEIAQIQNKLAKFNKDDDGSTKEPALVRNIAHFADQIAMRQGKQVTLMTTGFEDAQHLPQDIEDGLREIVTQLLRNSIVHGIELPEEREAKGKNRTGNITLTYKQKDGRGELAIQDDGAGINLEALREKLRNNPRFKDKNVDNMDAKLLYRALFLPGFSTAAKSSEDAGRGEGMSIVRDRIKKLPGGKIAIHSVPDSLSRFVVMFEG